jgi:hypothetical protein
VRRARQRSSPYRISAERREARLALDGGPGGGEHGRCGVVRGGQRGDAFGYLRGAERSGSSRNPNCSQLPSLRSEIGPKPISREVDKLSCVRFGSARYSVPNGLVGTIVLIVVHDGRVQVLEGFTGEVVADHALVAPGETSILDEHYGSARPDKLRRAPRARTVVEQQFLALGEVAEQLLLGAAAAGVNKLPTELSAMLTMHAAHGHDAMLAALARAVEFGRWRADEVLRSILAAAGAAPHPRRAGQALVLTLPSVPTRPLSDYAFGGEPS